MIYDDADLDRRRLPSIWHTSEPDPPREATAPDLKRIETALLAILDTPAAPHETIEVAFARKERAVADLFAQLTIIESRAMHARLANPAPNDRVAATFGRLVVTRRTRLLTFLADARRRQAVRRG